MIEIAVSETFQLRIYHLSLRTYICHFSFSIFVCQKFSQTRISSRTTVHNQKNRQKSQRLSIHFRHIQIFKM